MSYQQDVQDVREALVRAEEALAGAVLTLSNGIEYLGYDYEEARAAMELFQAVDEASGAVQSALHRFG